MNIIEKTLIVLGLISPSTVLATDSLTVDTAADAADSAVGMLKQAGCKADFSFESLEAVERFMKENSNDGQATPGGHLATDLEMKLFGIGSYVGEVMRRKLDGEWWGDDEDPVKLEIQFKDRESSDHIIWPVERVLKRFHNGEEDNIWDYARAIARDAGKY